jgi:L-lactate dehydrogenase (cytochrome)
MTRSVSVQEVSKHSISEDLWIVVNEKVYDLTEFAPQHPGGAASKSSFRQVKLPVIESSNI